MKGVANGNDRRSSQATPCSTSHGADPGNVGATTIDSVSRPSPKRAIANAGIRAGEIIAYRAWSVLNGKLRSMAAEFDWEPNGVPRWHKWIVSHEAKITDQPAVPYKSPNGVDEEMAGFHAFKSMRDVKFEYSPCDADDAVVYGQVKLWGTVYEHQYGYRAEYAKIHTLMEYRSLRRYHSVYEVLKSLREAYRVP